MFYKGKSCRHRWSIGRRSIREKQGYLNGSKPIAGEVFVICWGFLFVFFREELQSKEQREDQVLNFKLRAEIMGSPSHHSVSPCSRYPLLHNNHSKIYWSKTISISWCPQFCGSGIWVRHSVEWLIFAAQGLGSQLRWLGWLKLAGPSQLGHFFGVLVQPSKWLHWFHLSGASYIEAGCPKNKHFKSSLT